MSSCLPSRIGCCVPWWWGFPTSLGSLACVPKGRRARRRRAKRLESAPRRSLRRARIRDRLVLRRRRAATRAGGCFCVSRSRPLPQPSLTSGACSVGAGWARRARRRRRPPRRPRRPCLPPPAQVSSAFPPRVRPDGAIPSSPPSPPPSPRPSFPARAHPLASSLSPQPRSRREQNRGGAR